MEQGHSSLDELVMAVLTSCTNSVPGSISRETSVQDIMLDSLGIAVVVSQVEAVYDCSLSEPQLAELFQSRDVAEIIEGFSRVLRALSDSGR